MSQNVDTAIKDVHSNMAERNAKVINNVQSALKDTAQRNANEVDSVGMGLCTYLPKHFPPPPTAKWQKKAKSPQ